jgi:hypothetical protein
MAFQVTKEWLIPLTDDFEHQVDHDKLILWKTGITVACVVFKVPSEIGKIELLNQIREKIPENALEKLVSTKGEIVGLGYTQVDDYAEDKQRLSLYTFTASDTSCLQMAFFLDDPQDLDWAKSAWEATVFHPEETHKPRT